MTFVSRHLCSRPVCFAPPAYNETVSGHWYTDIKEYRLIGLDANYSYNSERGGGKWEHNTFPYPFNKLSQGMNTWSFKRPLSAVVTIDGSKITINGSRTEWDCGVIPGLETVSDFYEGIKPEIPDRFIDLSSQSVKVQTKG